MVVPDECLETQDERWNIGCRDTCCDVDVTVRDCAWKFSECNMRHLNLFETLEQFGRMGGGGCVVPCMTCAGRWPGQAKVNKRIKKPAPFGCRLPLSAVAEEGMLRGLELFFFGRAVQGGDG